MKIQTVWAELVYEGGRTDRHDETNSRFSQFREKRPTKQDVHNLFSYWTQLIMCFCYPFPRDGEGPFTPQKIRVLIFQCFREKRLLALVSFPWNFILKTYENLSREPKFV